MNTCKWNIGLLEGREILCGKPIMAKYTYCYGHEMQYRKGGKGSNADGYASVKDWTESTDSKF